ncbi:MAG TPA: hypothetical protein VFP14_09540 [Novosphingobium sp.]|nr:hypothetical protein [Novosphingobium sp.]
MISSWPCPLPGGSSTDEYAVAFDHGRSRRLLVVPALFDEANRLRRFTVETMRQLDKVGIDTFLPDLPGTNESALPLCAQSLHSWRQAMAAAARHFSATHVLALRGGALVSPSLPALALAPTGGAAILRQLVRSRILSAREAGRDETTEGLLSEARRQGIVLAGHALGAEMVTGLESAGPAPEIGTIAQAQLGGGALWLRAEPDDDPTQSAALAQIVAKWLRA